MIIYILIQIPVIIACLWDTLLDLDDLTASTGSIMTLLATVLSQTKSATGRPGENVEQQL